MRIPTRLWCVHGETSPTQQADRRQGPGGGGQGPCNPSARLGAAALGFELSDVLDVVMALTPADFYKSMTTHADHTVWQDVYRPSTRAGDVYLKWVAWMAC